MRLLLVTDAYPPLIGGADLQAQMLAQAMSSAGHVVAVATSWQPGLLEHELDGPVAVHRVHSLAERIPGLAGDPGRRHHPPFPDPRTTVALRRLIRRFRPDVVHSYGWISYSVSAALIGLGLPLILSARDYGYICGIRNFLYYRGNLCSGPAPVKCLRCASMTYAEESAGNAIGGRSGGRVGPGDLLLGMMKGAAAVTGTFLGQSLLRHDLRVLHTASRFVRRTMDAFLLDAGQSSGVARVVIPSFLPPRAPAVPDAAVLARLPAEPYILFVGALIPGKGIWPLLDAYSRLGSGAPPLVLLGQTSYKSPTSYPPGVVLLGAASHATVLAAWDRALFGVVPSVGAEAFGNVATEAMSRGRAVVASRIGGLVDIVVDGESGLLVEPGDPEELARAMERLITDGELRRSLGAAARERVLQFEASRILPRFEALYREVADARRRSTSGRAAANR